MKDTLMQRHTVISPPKPSLLGKRESKFERFWRSEPCPPKSWQPSSDKTKIQSARRRAIIDKLEIESCSALSVHLSDFHDCATVYG